MKEGASLTDGGKVSGASTRTLTLNGASTSEAGNYTVTVANGAGTTTSSTAILTKAASCAAPIITTQPQNQTVCVGAVATLAVGVGGPGPIVYQWLKDGLPLFDGVGTAFGANSAALVIVPVSLTDVGNYSVVVTTPGGTATSSSARLTPSPDSDGDGLCDCIDPFPNDPDANGDGILDGFEPAPPTHNPSDFTPPVLQLKQPVNALQGN
jgi:hypothetical protein